MTNTNEAVEVAVTEEVAAPKKRRAAKPRPTKTGHEIVAAAAALQAEVAELEAASQDQANTEIVRGLVAEAFEAKKAELAKVLDTKYTI
jgi:hypothetical protein